METGNQNSGVVNMTRALEALSPMLNNPRKTIIRVEVLVSVAAALMFLQFIFGAYKRLWHNSFVSIFRKVCNKLMFPFIVYILGTMQTSPIKNSVYPIWAVSLIMASEATGAFQQSDLLTIENMFSFFVECARYVFYNIMFIQLLSPIGLKVNLSWNWPSNTSSRCTGILFGLVCASKIIEGGCGLFFGFPHCKVVARWMKNNANSDDHSDSDTKSMNDYNYPVRCSFNSLYKDIYADEVPSIDKVTTINEIWGCFQNSNGGISADNKNRLKDVCLSFSLFELLKRRYFRIICAEASLRKTKYFVSKVLLRHPDDDYERAFKIVETELGLCYDFLFTKHQLIHTTGLYLRLWINWFVFFLTKIIFISVVGVYALKNSLFLETPSPIIEVHSAKADYIIALTFICIILMVYLLQAVFYIASDWVKVSLTCAYVKRKNCAPIAFILEIVIQLLCKINISAGCKNTIGNCSFLSDRNNSNPFNKMRTPTVKVSGAVKKAIANAVKKAIDNSLMSADGELTKGERALRMSNEYSQTLKDHSQIEVMLILHIATDYCHRALSDEGEDRDVAVKLSRYYAYLIEFVPELLPYDLADIRELICTVREETKKLRRSSETDSIMEDLEATGEEDNPKRIFMKGVKLGKQLAGMPNGAQRWEMLAKFWAETVVYITPSHHTAKHHMEHLESGGEFLTKIWALLSHAGILNLDREKDQGPKGAQPEIV